MHNNVEFNPPWSGKPPVSRHIGRPTRKYEFWTEVDYAIWCLLTGDEEETRLIGTEPSSGEWEEYRDIFIKKHGVTQADIVQLDLLVNQAHLSSDLHVYWDNQDKMVDILKKYASHQHLVTKDMNNWVRVYERSSLMR